MADKPKAEAAAPRTAHPTIATIATHMGLSRATVTHVLNGRATEQRIRPETQKRVLEVAQELGYRANASARAIRAGRFGSVALVQSQLGQYLPDELLYGLTSAIAARDLHLILTQIPNVDQTGESYVTHMMRDLSVDGVFVNRHNGSPPPFLERIRALRIPAVFLNAKQEFDSIYPDDLQGGALATEFLLRLGHERIAYVESGPWRVPHFSEFDRRAGYERAMAAAGLAPQIVRLPIPWRRSETESADQRVEAAAELLSRSDRPTAIVAYEMVESMAIARAALALGIRIPESLSLIHFHNRVDDRFFLPIHTVSNRMQEVGEGAVGMLLQKIQRPEEMLTAQAIPELLLEGATCMPRRSHP